MIQAIGLTGPFGRRREPVVDDLTFDARPGDVTVLLGPPGAGKTTTLRLLLGLAPHRGAALVRGRPVRRIPRPAREIGALLGDPEPHPGRTVRGHLKLSAAAAGVPAARADELMEAVGMTGLADRRASTLSRGMERRLVLATALIGDPHTLLLDEPTRDLDPREAALLHGLVRGWAGAGGTALVTSRDPAEAARIADRVISVADGHLVADQVAEDFVRTRLRPRVAVRTPHAERLASLLSREFRAVGAPAAARSGDTGAGPVGTAASGAAGAGPGPDRFDGPGGPTPSGFPDVPALPEVVVESGGRLSVYGTDCAEVGEIAHRHRLVLHELTRETGTTGDRRAPGPAGRADGRPCRRPGERVPEPRGTRERGTVRRAPLPAAPARPLRYEVLRWCGSRAMAAGAAAGVLLTVLLAGILAHGGHEGAILHPRVLLGWAPVLPVPVSALTAGWLGAAAVGQELRRPGLLPRVVGVRRCAPLSATIVVATTAALSMSALAALIGASVFPLFTGTTDGWVAVSGAAPVPALRAVVEGAGPAVCCAVLGPLLAAVFRSGAVGVSGVLLLPPALLVLAPLLPSGLLAPGSGVSPTGRLVDALGSAPLPGADLPATPAAWFPAFAETLARLPGVGGPGWWVVPALFGSVLVALPLRCAFTALRRRWADAGTSLSVGRIAVPRTGGGYGTVAGAGGGRRAEGRFGSAPGVTRGQPRGVETADGGAGNTRRTPPGEMSGLR
ncbi:ABC transporter ATP-binding protein [Streptomyces sp. ST2-7A]|uniref:ATP-binding cassette domain-containing protein n=1 Tax=Streptomyces sp. ST2-7A TaxID=2907214 RepID=UPI001F46F27D|nr:ABC transporter ATP-binding protein [Streptomyces sp. ST2-7A]MCE7081246.1 ABC transporter ATP-binding protein [Streptomyces sp. ST2-7A]